MEYTELMKLARAEFVKDSLWECLICALIIILIVISSIRKFRTRKEENKSAKSRIPALVFSMLICAGFAVWVGADFAIGLSRINRDIKSGSFESYEGAVWLKTGRNDLSVGRTLELTDGDLQVRIIEFDDRWENEIYFSDPPPGKATVVYGTNSRVVVVFEVISEDQPE
ncbi:MAG: hypothetical protein ACI3XR_02460 [Eubacteriales bacterium]